MKRIDGSVGGAEIEHPTHGRATPRADRPAFRYEQVMELVEALISERGLGPGDRLPPSHELARLAGVSLISVRRALEELERTGRVVRHQGVGTLVASPRIVSEPGRAGGLLDTLTDGEGPTAVTTRLISIARGVPSPTIARALGVEPGEPVWQIRRLRLIQARPTILERAVLPIALVPELDDATLRAGGSLYGFLAERYELRDDYEEQYLHVGPATADERQLLALPARQQVVRLRGVTFAADGTPFDCFEQVYPAAEFVFYISGQLRRHVLAAADVMDWEVAPVAQAPAARAGKRARPAWGEDA